MRNAPLASSGCRPSWPFHSTAAPGSRVLPAAPTRAPSCTRAAGTARSPCHCAFCTARRSLFTSKRSGSALLPPRPRASASLTRTWPPSSSSSLSCTFHAGSAAAAGALADADAAAADAAGAAAATSQRCTFKRPSPSRATASDGCSSFTLPSTTLRPGKSSCTLASTSCFSDSASGAARALRSTGSRRRRPSSVALSSVIFRRGGSAEATAAAAPAQSSVACADTRPSMRGTRLALR